VLKGVKEAKWNHKYMKVLERPVTLVEKAKDMQTVATNISVVLKTL
jgi:hypothetical protein